ncbi:MAG: hypothetical protein NVSMB7_11460 [Chitinophagaceae bacterium]
MENRNTILNELMSISPVVAGIGNQNPYFVPAAYFEELAMQLVVRIAMEEKAGSDPVLNIHKTILYQAPPGYFDNLAGNIMQRIKAQETGNAKEELELISPLLGQIGKKTPFTSPEGYFTDFSDNIMAGVKAIEFVNEELENLSPTMIDLKNRHVYEVPEGYFDATVSAILHKVKQQPAKVIAIGFRKKIMRYAAAAVVTGIIVLAGYLYSGKKSVTGSVPDIAKATAAIPDQEMESFLNNNTVALADIGTDTVNTAMVNDSSTNADDTKDLLANISDEELQQYMDQRPEAPISN